MSMASHLFLGVQQNHAASSMGTKLHGGYQIMQHVMDDHVLWSMDIIQSVKGIDNEK